MTRRSAIAAVCLALAALPCPAQVPALLNYQGRLVSGTELVNGSVGLSLRFYDAVAAGNLLYEDSNTVTVVDGLYSTFIGDDTTAGSLAGALTNAEVYIEVAVNGAALAPRERLAAVGYAALAGDVPGNVFWRATGNTGLSASASFVGHRDGVPLDFRVNNARALRLVPQAASPHVIGGHTANTTDTDTAGATIGGGGRAGAPNRIDSVTSYGTIGGGAANRIGDGSFVTEASTIAGGLSNQTSSSGTTVGGGQQNTAKALYATVSGGFGNRAEGNSATVAGGSENTASNNYAIVLGGSANTAGGAYSLAAGSGAVADHEGTFVWADTSVADYFRSSATNQFLIRAANGVGINTRGPFTDALTVNGGIRATGIVYGASFVGGGSGLTMLNGTNIAAGTVSNAALAQGAVTGAKVLDGSLSGADMAANTFWETDGNAGTDSTDFLGTTDAQPLALRANNMVGLRLYGGGASPNVVGGYTDNTADVSVAGATISGGGGSAALLEANRVSDSFGTVGGGAGNRAGDSGGSVLDAAYAVVGGGWKNAANGPASVIGGGALNTANGTGAAVGGGSNNTARSENSTVAGGHRNDAAAVGTFVGGGVANVATGLCSAIAGGTSNRIDSTALFTFIGAGYGNVARSDYAVLAGGVQNSMDGFADYAAIVGGQRNELTDLAYGSFIGAGYDNTISGRWAVVISGRNNSAGNDFAVVGGGSNNTAQGLFAVVPGGLRNSATGYCSIAAGQRAKAVHDGSFVWADTQAADFSSTMANQVALRASNGVWIAQEAGENTAVPFGTHYRDNAVVAWAKVDDDGTLTDSFNVDTVTNAAVGRYDVLLKSGGKGASQLIPVANAELDAQPASAATVRLVSIDQTATNHFRVYINDGTFAPVNTEFTVVVFGR